MTIECKCGESVDYPAAVVEGWRITTDGPRNALVWLCPACWAKRMQELDLIPKVAIAEEKLP